MEEWFTALTLYEKIYWGIAIISTVILVFLMISTLMGGDVDDMSGDLDTDIEGDTGVGFQFLSFKNLMGFFTIFGWSGIACLEEGLSIGLAVLISVVCGSLMMLAMASLFYYLGKMQSSGTLQLKNALHQIGEVYLTIGANRSSMGKVSITVQGALRELDALTDEDTNLVTGNVVEVNEITNNGILIVKLVNK